MQDFHEYKADKVKGEIIQNLSGRHIIDTHIIQKGGGINHEA